MKIKRSKSLSPEPSSSRDIKRIKLEEIANLNGSTSLHILEFSDDVLLNILKYLHPQDLMAISLCCQRFAQLTQDRTLWRRADFRTKPIYLEDLNQYMKFLQPITMSLAMRGNLISRERSSLTQRFFNNVKTLCDQLKELIIEEYYINGDKIHITDFPCTIEKLSLEGCKMNYLQSNKSYFFKMDLHMPNLTILDLRDTALGDSEVGCFSSTKTLTHLYLECPSTWRNDESPEVIQHRQQQALRLPIFEDGNLAQFLVEDGFSFENYGFQRCLISDRAICALGSDICDRERVNSYLAPQRRIIILREDIREDRREDRRISNNPNLKTLVVRNYPRVTNSSLIHLALNASRLEYLDVTGTSVTRDGVESFKSQKNNVKVVSSFDET
ncbi:PREDICTED: uncharacterized protein LOC105147868 isoform X2 [Acromyrmex echinatior]|uniref:uncharacterized protein LOC105147868 isoform X2 n=1 Tax=Acromyrmex echinatior TaxID=103372 RepID=UPI000580C880|nr:PREDICTED: uncharacterized protein LOC105147868 isoform X2 [Acromyrmex echinatior]